MADMERYNLKIKSEREGEEMSERQKLKLLLENEIIPDLEEAIDDIFKTVERQKSISIGEREELEDMQEMHRECREILIEIESGEMDDEEAGELLGELMLIKSGDKE